ncbi:MAG: flagellar hook-basal body complex protein FliE [Alphaproteobacteria bacterium]|nr:flagellar hook-basal body complex protein FliE [Alphaproteobacteria bacterium]
MNGIKGVGISQLSTSTALTEARAALNASKLKQSATSEGFGDRLGNALNGVAEAQNNAASLARAYEMGVENDLSKVMISQQISSLGFQLTLNARNKVLSAYKDIMNMPV